MKKIILILLILFILAGCKTKPITQNFRIFSEDLMAVEKNGDWGYVNKQGEEVIEFKFDRAAAFYKDLAIVIFQGKANLINKEGKLRFSTGFDTIYLDEETKLYIVIKQRKYGLLTTEGEILVDLTYDRIKPFSHGLAMVVKNDKFGFMDSKGNLAIDLVYDEANVFSYGFAPVRQGELWGYINTDDTVVVDFQYDYAYPVHKDLHAIVTTLDETRYIFHLIDMNNVKTITNANFIKGDGPIYAVLKNSNNQLYKSDGSLFLNTAYEGIEEVEGYYIGIIQDEQLYQTYFKASGEIIAQNQKDSFFDTIRINYVETTVMTYYDSSGLSVYYDNKTILLNAQAITQVLPNDLYIVIRENKFGIINKDSEVILDFEYESLVQGSDGYIIFRENSRYGVLNSKYQEVVSAIYDGVWPWVNISNFGQAQ